ncbi:MAG: transcription termination/antitermination protein NusG, partial [Mycobacterium sp.]|nr:transcription termination/antitermination protein NusG [Mycobacterium sp.]
MTTFDGETPSGVSDALAEAADPAIVIADEAAESLEQNTAEAVAEAGDAEPTDELVADEAAADEAAADEAAAEDEDIDPVEALKKDLRLKPGEWYVIHSYAGYENKVKANLETRVQNLDVGDYIFQVEVPTEEVTEIKNGQRKQVNRKVLPGYILVRMELTDESWSAVRNTP